MQSRRLRQLPPYLFEEIDRGAEEARARGVEVVDLGVGDPDRPTDPALVEALREAAGDARFHRYPPGRGLAPLRRAIAARLERRLAFSPDPDTEVMVTIGSKEAIGHFPLAVVDPGQTVLVPDPGYPVYRSASTFAGAKVAPFRLEASRGFLPDLSAVDVPETGRLCFLNYPNNPTGASADPGFLRAALRWADERGLILANDAAYADLVLDGGEPCTLLQSVTDLRAPVIEFYSFSKVYQMTGWRIGFAVGRSDLIDALARVKSNLDSGCFGAVQEAVRVGLENHHDRLVEGVRRLFRERRDRATAVLRELGYRFETPRAGFYLWIRVPGGGSSLEFAAGLLDQAGVVVSPGIGFGEAGEGYFRISLTAPDAEIDEACRRLREMGTVEDHAGPEVSRS